MIKDTVLLIKIAEGGIILYSENCLVSIILPIYNVEKYLDRCIKSIVEQTYYNLEIILVIDGATDNSYNIAKEWEKRDKRIKVIYQKNSGSGPARNKGIFHSKGNFIVFVDPDDWIEKNMIQSLLAYQKDYNADLVISKSRTVSPNGVIISEEQEMGKVVLNSQEDARKAYLYLLGRSYLGAPTRKLYCRKIINDYDITFPNLRRSQDIVFNYRYYNFVKSVVAVDDIFYNYTVDTLNYTNKLPTEYYETLAIIFNEIIDYCKKWKVDINTKDYTGVCNYLFHSIVANLESNYVRREDFSRVYQNSVIKKIISDASPTRLDEVLLQKYCLKEKKITVSMIVKLRLFYKRFFLKYNKQSKFINGKIGSSTLHKLQMTQLEMLKVVKEICKKENIKYFITDGTLLGAVRHQGFIPWDDDLDIAMPREDYNKFIQIAQKEFGNTYFLQTWDTDYSFPFPYAKMLKCGTKCVEAVTSDANVKEGIFIDIFPIDHCGSEEEMRREILMYLFWSKILLMKCGYKVWRANGSRNKYIKYLPFIFLSKFFSRKALIKLINSKINKWNNKYKNTNKCYENVGYNFLPWIMNSRFFDRLVEINFERELFFAPERYDDYLSDIYGNYMEFPPEEERENRHNIKILKF